MKKLQIPQQVEELMRQLAKYHYKSYVVGEAVRDLLVGEKPLDYDVITDADITRLPVVFSDYRIFDENAGKGELIVMVRGMAIMVSPYRAGIDGGEPIYTAEPRRDLARRGFSVNAIAYTLETGLYDPFDGASCLAVEPYTLKALGEPRYYHDYDKNQQMMTQAPESISAVFMDPVCILQGLEMVSREGYRFDSMTKQNVIKAAPLLRNLPPEPVRKSFEKILMGKRVFDALSEHRAVVFALFPEMEQTNDFNQYSRYHRYSLFEHVCKSVSYAPPELNVRLALLFHGAGKPDCYAMKPEGYATYYGHAERASIYARRWMKLLDYDENTITEVQYLIENHDSINVQTAEDVEELQQQLPLPLLKKLMLVHYANTRAKVEEFEQEALNVKRLCDGISGVSQEKYPRRTNY